ncbi:hypothetical protein PCANC_02560 [Puccinia coronata f. sp. avenae]|uniref:Core-binding (CB) domain-containing protein n=1 Tax=Puccinia coronata f. sp. avenae TaxID=200324 RepID=A0A2N5VYH0_9BASI|nr:hypothetical protein PCANC_02560 [Puccinia coronata f. sp. avenae]
MLELEKIQPFLRDGSHEQTKTPIDLHMLRGYEMNTLISYNAAVKKLGKSMEAKGVKDFKLPLSCDNIYNFCYWAGREEGKQEEQDVTAKTLDKYLYGLKAWHLFHKKQYPTVSDARVKVMLRASAKEAAEAPTKEKKEAALLDLSLVAFWSLARLGELTYHSERGPPSERSEVRKQDALVRDHHSKAKISLRDAKTSKPGETQELILLAQNHCLCPVQALLRRMKEASLPEDSQKTHYSGTTTKGALGRT